MKKLKKLKGFKIVGDKYFPLMSKNIDGLVNIACPRNANFCCSKCYLYKFSYDNNSKDSCCRIPQKLEAKKLGIKLEKTKQEEKC